MKSKSMITVVIMMLCITINAQEQSNKTLVAYFSATGTTEKAAKLIVEVTGGTLYEIQPEKEYVTADLDWHDKSHVAVWRCQMLNHALHYNLNRRILQITI